MSGNLQLNSVLTLITNEPFTPFVLGVGLSVLVGLILYYRMRAKHGDERRNLENQAKQVEAQLSAQTQTAIHERDLVVERLKADLDSLQSLYRTLQEQEKEWRAYKEEFVRREACLKEQLVLAASEKELVENAKKEMVKEFEALANKLFEQKQSQFNQSSKLNMETVLTPFKSQLKDFNKRVEDIYHKENSERNQLLGQILELQKQTQKIGSDANNLAKALKGDNKLQGSWGEIILERLLEQSGLVRGREYEIQESYKNSEGKRFRPDVIVHLPEGKDIVIDSKVSLLDYERFSSLDDLNEKESALKAHVDSIRTHIKSLSKKQYENLEGIRTLDFVFIFIPVEAAYLVAMQASPTLFKEAHDKNIVLVSPSSLMVALRTVETIWRYEKQNTNAEEIASSAGKLYDQFVVFSKSMEDIGRYVDKASEAYSSSMKQLSSGRGNVLKRIDNLKQLGAKTSKNLPSKVQTAIDLQSDSIEGVIEKGETTIKKIHTKTSSSEESI